MKLSIVTTLFKSEVHVIDFYKRTVEAADSLFKFSPGNSIFSTDWSEVDFN